MAGRATIKRFMKSTNTDLNKLNELCDKLEAISEEDTTSNSSIKFLFRPVYRYSTFGCCLIMFASCLSSTCLFLGTGQPDRLLIDNFLLSLFDMVGVVFMSFFMDKFGRTRTLVGCFLIIGCNLLLATVITTFFTAEWALLVSNVLKRTAKTANGISFGAAFSFTAELFPTYLRSTAVGFVSAISRFGGLISPFILELGKTNTLIPPGIVSLVCFTTAYFTTKLPETNKKPLLQSEAEAVEFYQLAKSSK